MKLYTTHRDAGGWSSRSGRDTVQFSYFLQKNRGLTSTTSLQVPIEDSEPIFMFGFSAGKIGTILLNQRDASYRPSPPTQDMSMILKFP